MKKESTRPIRLLSLVLLSCLLLNACHPFCKIRYVKIDGAASSEWNTSLSLKEISWVPGDWRKEDACKNDPDCRIVDGTCEWKTIKTQTASFSGEEEDAEFTEKRFFPDDLDEEWVAASSTDETKDKITLTMAYCSEVSSNLTNMTACAVTTRDETYLITDAYEINRETVEPESGEQKTLYFKKGGDASESDIDNDWWAVDTFVVKDDQIKSTVEFIPAHNCEEDDCSRYEFWENEGGLDCVEAPGGYQCTVKRRYDYYEKKDDKYKLFNTEEDTVWKESRTFENIDFSTWTVSETPGENNQVTRNIISIDDQYSGGYDDEGQDCYAWTVSEEKVTFQGTYGLVDPETDPQPTGGEMVRDPQNSSEWPISPHKLMNNYIFFTVEYFDPDACEYLPVGMRECEVKQKEVSYTLKNDEAYECETFKKETALLDTYDKSGSREEITYQEPQECQDAERYDCKERSFTSGSITFKYTFKDEPLEYLVKYSSGKKDAYLTRLGNYQDYYLKINRDDEVVGFTKTDALGGKDKLICRK